MELCEQTRDWLLHAEDASRESCPSPDLGEHLKSCYACGQLATEIKMMEQAWRTMPVPPACHQAQAAFLRQLAQRKPTVAPVVHKLRFRPRLSPWAVAAMLLLTAGLAGWLFLPDNQVRAADDVVGRLIEWNLDLAQASTLEARNRLYATQQPALHAAVRQEELPAEDRVLAESLLDNGVTLVSLVDPMGEADRFTDLADRVLDRADSAAKKGNSNETTRLVVHYRRLVEKGINANLDKVRASPALDGDKKRRLDKHLLRDEKRLKKLETLLDQAPEASRREIRRTMEVSRKKHDHKTSKGKKG